jgi:hypothetical protein
MPDLTSPDAKLQPEIVSFSNFVSSRCRAYILSDMPVGYPISGVQGQIWNYYSSGEALNDECIMVSAWRNMLGWLDMIHADSRYEEGELLVEEVGDNSDHEQDAGEGGSDVV